MKIKAKNKKVKMRKVRKMGTKNQINQRIKKLKKMIKKAIITFLIKVIHPQEMLSVQMMKKINQKVKMI